MASTVVCDMRLVMATSLWLNGAPVKPGHVLVVGFGEGWHPGKAEGMENAVPQRQVLLGCALGQAGRPRHDARLLDHFVAGELLAGQVHLRSIWKAIPPVDSLPAAISTEHLSQQQLAAEQVVDGQR